eukprot:jgi/Bigna1/86973/estExt_fgenesh1_pg.C_150203
MAESSERPSGQPKAAHESATPGQIRPRTSKGIGSKRKQGPKSSDISSREKRLRKTIEPTDANLKTLMYARGDDKEPLQESVDLLKGMICEFIRSMIQDALKIAPRDNHVNLSHIKYALRKDRPKAFVAEKRYTHYKELEKERRKATKFTF